MGFLTNSTPLQIKIYTKTNAAPASPSAADGVISFDKISQRIGIHGMWFGQSSADISTLTDNLNKALTSLNNNHLISRSGNESSGYTYTIGNDIIGDLTSATVTGASDTKVASLLSALQTQITNLGNTYATDAELTDAISGINTTISALNATVGSTSVASGKHVAVEVVETAGKLTGLTVTESDIASNTELQTVKGTANSAVQSVNGITGTTVVIGAKDLKVAQGVSGGVTGNFFNKDNQNDTVLQAIQKLDTALNNITGTNLKDINDAITAIKNELINGTGDDADLATTLIDKLSTFLGGATQWTVNSTNDVTDVADLITELKAYAKNYADGLADDYDAAGTATNAIAALDATVGATAVASGKHVAVEVVETDGILTSLTVTEDDIASAATVNTLSGDVTTLKGAEGVTGSVAYSVKNASDALIGATNAAANTNTINGAKKYAENYANTLISWEVDPS